MKNKIPDYKEYLIECVQSYKGEFNKIIYYIPHFYSILCDLLNEDKVNKEMRHLINAALAYFVTPMDVIPEEIYGPYGYIDDLFLCCYVMKKLKEIATDNEIFEKNWELDEDFNSVLDKCYTETEIVIEAKDLKDEILEYVGINN